jgi:hypothetical protein
VYQQVPELEQRLSELQAQIDRLSLSLHLWRQSQDHLQPMERRLADLTNQCAEILDRWTETGDRHVQVVNELETRLNAWNDAETRLQQDAAQRLHQLERIIEREWTELRRIHAEPMLELREQAANLGAVSVAAAQSAQAGFEKAEARLVAIEGDLHRWMSELSRDVHAVVAGDRPRPNQQGWPASGSTAWPLDGVMRLHEQIRQEGGDKDPVPVTASSGTPATTSAAPAERPALPAAPPELVDRLKSLERTVAEGQTELRESASKTERVTRTWGWAAAALAAGAALTAGLAWQSLQQARQASTRVAEVELRSQQVRDAADRDVAATREAAARELAEAREAAASAQTIGNVLAAPDLVRINLRGPETGPPMSGLLLWSRSRGLVFSGSRLPSPPVGSTYQVWLLTSGDAVSASTFLPDTAGRITIYLDTPPRVPRPVLGASVTIEPTGGSQSPSADVLLSRMP